MKRSHLEGQQQGRPLFTPQVGEDGRGHDGERQTHQDPDLTRRKRVQQCLISASQQYKDASNTRKYNVTKRMQVARRRCHQKGFKGQPDAIM